MKFYTIALCVGLTYLPSTILAGNITGQVTDDLGQPVIGAKVYIEGSNIQVTTGADGRYVIEEKPSPHVHLHVYSPKHVHGDRIIHASDASTTANFTLRNTQVENVLVTANPMVSSVLESTVPVSVLVGEALKRSAAPTLGDTLAKLPGVHSTAFGPVASSPIIRGSDGPRVKIVQNGLDISDASRVGPDHNVATETSTAVQIEVLRGPSTLQYGSGAIGGVVNVVDNRILSKAPEKLSGQIDVNAGTVADERAASGDLAFATGPFAWHVDGFSRKTKDYDIPGFAESDPHEDESPGTLENSAIDAQGGTVGGSWIANRGYLGIAYQQLDNIYGVPGHGHEEEEEEEEEGEGEEEIVELDVTLSRWQLAGEWYSPITGINAIKVRAASSDYEHVELENGDVGTTFANETQEGLISFEHDSIASWHGIVGLHYSTTDYSAVGEEAYTPANASNHSSIYAVEEKNAGDFTWQVGARLELSDYDVKDTVLIELDHESPATLIDVPDQSFTSASASLGSIWQYADGYSLAVSLSHSERAPSHQEMFSAGQHISTRTYDLGLAYILDEAGNVTLNQNIEQESAQNIDLTWRKFEGNLGIALSLFRNNVNDYIYQRNTGLVAEAGHEEEEGEEEEAEGHMDTLPVYAFRQEDAVLTGFEAEVSYVFSPLFRADLLADFVSANLDSGEDLPRIPPLRLASAFSFSSGPWLAELSINYYDNQNNTAPFETATDSYTLVDTYFAYQTPQDLTLYVKGTNLGDKEARPHASFIKDLAPAPGRGFVLGARMAF